MPDAWDEATFAGAAAARSRRLSRLSPQQRLAWLEAALRDAELAGALADTRRRRHESALEAWESTAAT